MKFTRGIFYSFSIIVYYIYIITIYIIAIYIYITYNIAITSGYVICMIRFGSRARLHFGVGDDTEQLEQPVELGDDGHRGAMGTSWRCFCWEMLGISIENMILRLGLMD